MNKLEANVNIDIKNTDIFNTISEIFHKMLNDENINVGVRLKYIKEYNDNLDYIKNLSIKKNKLIEVMKNTCKDRSFDDIFYGTKNKIEKENNMNVPFVKVNNLKEFERVVAKMEREIGLKLDGYIADIYTVVGLNDTHSKITTWNEKFISDKIISADEYLTGIRENFTLDDLEETMIVELRNKDRLIYFGGVLSTFVWSGGTFITSDVHMKLNRTNNDLTDKDNEKFDIMKIYKPKTCCNINMNLLKSDSNLVLIFDAEAHRRNKYKISQRKSEIENEMAKLQEELKSLEAK